MGIKTISTITKFLDVNTTRKGNLSPNKDKPACPSKINSIGMPREIPENTGVSSKLISDYLSELYADKTLNLHDIIIVKDGKIITEAYFGANVRGIPKATFSACKSIVSLAIGVLVDQEKLSLDSKLVDIFESLSPIAKLKMKNMTVEDLLTMKSGMVSCDELCGVTEEDLFGTFVNTSLSSDPGKKFKYNSLNTYMLSAIVKKVSGKGLSEFLDEHIFSYLGIKDYYWERCKKGTELGGWGLYMLPEDMAKLGVLVMNCGVYEGKRLVSEDYIRRASSTCADVHAEIDGFDYGYQMWCSPDSSQFLFNGMLGQNVWGFRNNGIVIVNNSGNEELFQHSNYFDITRKYFCADFPAKAPRSIASQKELKNTLEKIKPIPHFELKKSRRLPRECIALDGAKFTSSDSKTATMGLMPLVWQGVENNYSKGFKAISFEIKERNFYFNYIEKEESHRVAVGFGCPKYSEQYFDGAPYLVSCVGEFAFDEDKNKVLKLRVDFLETPCSLEMKIYFGKDQTCLLQREMPGRVIVTDKLGEFKRDMESKPIISGVASILDDDVLKYCVERLFEYKITLKEEN